MDFEEFRRKKILEKKIKDFQFTKDRFVDVKIDKNLVKAPKNFESHKSPNVNPEIPQPPKDYQRY